jgi:hypothetical protein
MNVILEDGCLPCQDRAADTVTAAGGPVAPPAAWFADPQLDGLTPLTVTDDGRVFGHLAAWGACHIGIGNACVQPPRGGDYSLFATGVIRTQEGTDVPVGQVTLAGGHADLRLGARAAIAHYDDTRSALADVAVGEDEHGPWVAGALRPGVTDEDLRAFRASPPSGDWRPIGGALKLVAACSVNVQGFPIPRVRARVASGSTVALIAGGVLARTARHRRSVLSGRLSTRRWSPSCTPGRVNARRSGCSPASTGPDKPSSREHLATFPTSAAAPSVP